MSIEAMKQALDAIELARSSHDVMLLSDPPQQAWKYHGVDWKLLSAVQNLRQAIAEEEHVKTLKEKTEEHDVDCLCADCEAFDNMEDRLTKSELNAMYCRGRDDGFEAGRQQGMKQERALWELARIGQEIEAEAEKQEPVDDHFDCGTYVGSHRGKEIKNSIGDELPKREPLTDEQILEILCIHLDEDDDIEDWRHEINEARAIEAAHGIGEKK